MPCSWLCEEGPQDASPLKPDTPQFAFQFLVLRTELRVWCSSACELLGYPPASLTFVNALYQNEDIIFLLLWLLAWFIWLSALCILTWLAGHGGVCIWIWGIWRRRQKDGVHSQAGCYIRAVSKAKGHHRKQTAHLHMPSSALPLRHMLDCMNLRNSLIFTSRPHSALHIGTGLPFLVECFYILAHENRTRIYFLAGPSKVLVTRSPWACCLLSRVSDGFAEVWHYCLFNPSESMCPWMSLWEDSGRVISGLLIETVHSQTPGLISLFKKWVHFMWTPTLLSEHSMPAPR